MKLPYILLLFASSLVAQDAYFSSDEITAEGNRLLLSGNVVLKHNFGTLQANRAEINRYENSELSPMISAIIKDGVSFAFEDNSKTLCHQAEIDFSEKTVTFSSDTDKVLFTTGDNEISFEGTSIRCRWSDDKGFAIENIIATNGVKLVISEDIEILADTASFEATGTNSPLHRVSGEVQILSSDPNHPCSIKKGDNVVYSPSGVFDITTHTILLEHPIGLFLSNSLSANAKESIKMTADSLEWDLKNNLVTIGHDARLEQTGYGSFYATKGFTFQKDSQDGSDHFQSFGQTIFEDLRNFKLFSESGVTFQKNENELIATNEKDPLFIEKENLLLSGKKISLHYDQDGIGLITLTKDVAIQTAGITAQVETILYNKKSRELTVLPHDSGTVEINFDGQTNVITMGGLHVNYDEKTNELTAKAKGRVHFTIDDSQHQKLIDKVVNCTKNLFLE